MFDSLREGLLNSYKPKIVDDTVCAICGSAGRPLSLHLLEYYHGDDIKQPVTFAPMSQSHGTTRGSIPICTSCATPCSKCGLPIKTSWHKKIGILFQSQSSNITVRHGQGYCRHVHLFAALAALFKPVRGVTAKPPQGRNQPAEQRVRTALKDIERAETIPGFEFVREGIRKQLKDVERTQATIDEDGLSPAALVYLLASNVASEELCSGQHHVYRGVLTYSGKALLSTFEKSSQLMVECKIHSQEEHERDVKNLRKEIAEIG